MTNIAKLSLNSKTITDEVNGIAETLETQTDAIKQINNGVELNIIIDGHNQQRFDGNRMLLLRLRCEAAILISPRLFPCIWRKTWGYVII